MAAALPEELLALVIDFALGDTGPQDALIDLEHDGRLAADVLRAERQRRTKMRSLALSCRRLARIVEPWYMRRILLDSTAALGAFRRRVAGREAMATRVRMLIVCNVGLERPGVWDESSWDHLEAERDEHGRLQLPDDADVFALRDDNWRAVDANLDHLAAILRSITSCRSLAIASPCAPGFDPRPGRGLDRLQPLQLPSSLRSFSAATCIAADLFDRPLPSLANLATWTRFRWNWETARTMWGEDYQWTRSMLTNLTRLRIHLPDLDFLHIDLRTLLVEAPALVQLDLHLYDASNEGTSAEEVEIIAMAGADLKAWLVADPSRRSALRHVGVWDMPEPDGSIIAAVPHCVEHVAFHAASADVTSVASIAAAVELLGPSSRLKRVVVDSPALARSHSGPWPLHTAAGLQVGVELVGRPRASLFSPSPS